MTEETLEQETAPLTEVEALQEAWPGLSTEEREDAFAKLGRSDAEELFFNLSAADRYELIAGRPKSQKRSWLRLLEPDDVADLIQEAPQEERESLLMLLDEVGRREVTALLAYEEDEAGGLMSPRFIRMRPDVSVDVAIRYIRAQARRDVETVSYAYCLDHDQKLLGVVSFRDLLLAPGDRLVSEIMETDVETLPETMDQEEVSRRFAHLSLPVLPVVDADGRMKGIVTVDDVVDVVEEEATEDIQKLGGSEALDEPYLHIALAKMIKKRAGWLTVLFLGEMLTATAMAHYEAEIERAVVLALFIPLIISSGGNSGSQAATLITRALALREVRLRDWWRVFLRELSTGLCLGLILGSIGFMRVLLWPNAAHTYGEHYIMVGLVVSLSLVGVVLWGSLSGSMLPFLLRRLGLDPATASAPFVATLVDVTGLVIYFTVANILLGGRLL